MVNTRQKILDYLKKADWPSTTEDVAADVKVSYVNAGVAGFKGIKNAIFGGDDKINANAYMDVGITKFQLGRYER